MRKFLMILLGLVVVAFLIGITSHYAVAKKGNCVTIQDGILLAKTGEVLTTGYDKYGYNYQAHLFNGRYCDYDRVEGGSYCDVYLVMKWNDAWLSNRSCDGDLYLDRPSPVVGSGAWCTNHQSGWVDVNGKSRKWTYFVKIVAVPENAYMTNGTWYLADGTELGAMIWGSYAIVQQIVNDPSEGAHGKQYVSPAGPGLGKWKQ